MTDSKKFYSYSPLSGKKTGPYENMDRKQVNSLIEKAAKSQKKWALTPVKERLKYIKKMIKVISQNAHKYAEMISKDNGKSMIEALISDLIIVLIYLEYYAKNAEKILKPKKAKGIYLFMGKKAFITYEPLGVVGVISPWNYPLNLSFVPAISAVIAGNSVLLKPSSQTPDVYKIIEDIVKKSELPSGVLSVVKGKGISGQYLAEGNIQKLFFTGSTAIGKMLAKICAERPIPVELELGGSDPCIILDDADLERASKGVVWGSLLNSGQTCISVERIYVTKKNYDAFIELLKENVTKIKMGKDIDADIGAMTSRSQIDEIKRQLDDAVKKGAKIIYGGKIEGDFIEPTIIGPCTHKMDIINEETFGPIIAVVKTKNDEESLMLANDSKYGLSSSIYGKKENALEFAKKLEAGSININNSLQTFAIPSLPFGGVKDSGIGRYHAEDGLYTFCNIKSILVDNLTFLKEDFFWSPYGKNGYKKMLKFVQKYWGTKSPLKFLSVLPLMFKKK